MDIFSEHIPTKDTHTRLSSMLNPRINCCIRLKSTSLLMESINLMLHLLQTTLLTVMRVMFGSQETMILSIEARPRRSGSTIMQTKKDFMALSLSSQPMWRRDKRREKPLSTRMCGDLISTELPRAREKH